MSLTNNEITEASVVPLAKVHIPAGFLKGVAKIALEVSRVCNVRGIWSRSCFLPTKFGR